MPLVHNNLLNIFAGVSKQTVGLRLPNNCEEMINMYPTIDSGLRRRNPTEQVSTNILTATNQFLYSYDRGLSGDTSEQYIITIDNQSNLRVFDIQAAVYRTVTYSANALKYLQSSNPEIGFSAITVKDTTFIANKDIIPAIEGVGLASTINKVSINFDMNSYSYNLRNVPIFLVSYYIRDSGKLAPARVLEYNYGQYSQVSGIGATTTIVVDGVSLNYVTKIKTEAFNYLPESIDEYRVNICNLLNSTLDGSKYRASLGVTGNIEIYKLDGTAIVATSSVSFPTTEPIAPPNVYFGYTIGAVETTANKHITPIINIVASTFSGNLGVTSDYDLKAFVWIKSVSPDAAFPYIFTLSIKDTDGTLLGTTTSNATTSNSVAGALATWADTLTGFTAVSSGSMLKISRDNGAKFEIILSDTYGSQASSGFIGVVTSMDDLPKHFPFKDTIVKVDGLDRLDDNAYWVKYDGTSWVESRDPRMNYRLIDSTMPHKLVRNADFTFTLSSGEYNDIMVGDEFTNPLPEFVGSSIRDLFFINGRFGILTKNGISLSQQGEFGNFFRTTILQLLDDSAITTYIDSNKSVGLEYVAELGDKLVIFGDKQQFYLDASKGITPSTISVSNISGYDINKNVKPISHGDSVYFMVSKGDYSALMKMDSATLQTATNADDVSAHVPRYIDGDVIQLIGSIRNQVIFIRSKNITDTVYVYKSHLENNDDKQKSWSKWKFSSSLSSIFCFDKYLYLFGSRYNSTVPTEEYTFVLNIDYSKTILFETTISYSSISSSPSFEKISIDPYELTHSFKDNGTVRYNSEVELSEWFLASKDGAKEVRGSLLMKTIQISSVDGSDFSLIVEDKERSTSRVIPSIYTVDRKPYVSGNSKNMRIKLKSNNGNGFQINSISLEGQFNNRSTRQ